MASDKQPAVALAAANQVAQPLQANDSQTTIHNEKPLAFAPLPLVNERLPLLSHFGPKRFEAGIGC
jgi:hypothetical protein